MKLVVLFLFIFLFLSGCAQRSTPAPVVSISTPSVVHKKSAKASIQGNRYTVQKGDTLFSIAWRASVDFRHLASMNKIKKPYRIYPGQQLVLNISKNVNKHSTKPGEKVITNSNNSVVNNKLKKPDKKLADQKQGEYVQNNKTDRKRDKKQNIQVSNKIRKWIWPVKGKILVPFSNKETGNKGIDIGGKQGKKIVAAADGKVVYAGNALRGYGNLIIVKHNDDYLSAYAHNQRIRVKEKSLVKAGQHIADMGNTDAESMRLHFEIRYRGKSVNPLKYLPKR